MKLLWLTSAILAISLTWPLRGDIIELADGSKISGTLTRTGNIIIIKSEDGKIITTKPTDIAHVTLIGSPATAALAPPTGLRLSDVTPYAIIPLHGTFGEDINEDVFQAGIEAARRCGATHIFLSLDSVGGSVATAQKIAEIIKKNSKNFKFVCLVEKKAFSASIWVAFSCDAICMTGDGVLGAAVAFTRDKSGNAIVSAKMNSAIAAEICAIAETKGYPTAIVRAMIQEGSEAYAWHDEGGDWKIDSTKSAVQHSEMLTLSNGKTILTLTAREAVKIGLAKSCQTVPECASRLGFQNPIKVTVEPEQIALICGTLTQFISYNKSILEGYSPDEEQWHKSWSQTAIKFVGSSPGILPADKTTTITQQFVEANIQRQMMRITPRVLSLATPYHGGWADDQKKTQEYNQAIDKIFSDAGKSADGLVRDWLADVRSTFPKYVKDLAGTSQPSAAPR